MLEKIKRNSPKAWTIYFAILFFFWIIIPIALFIACLPDEMTGVIVVMTYTTFFIGGSIYRFNKDLHTELSGTDVGYMSAVKLGGKILLILKSGSGFIFPVPGILKLVIYSVRERNVLLRLEGIETADPAQVNYKSFGLKKDDFDDIDLNPQMKIDLEFNLFYHPEEDEDGFECYLKNTANYEGNDGGVDQKLLELAPDVAKNILLVEANKRTPAIINFQRAEINEILKTKMQAEISFKDKPERSWGIRIPRLQLSRLLLPDSVVAKMEEKVLFHINQYMRLKSAKVDADIVRVTAEAKEFELTYIGRGSAKAEMFRLKTVAVGERLIGIAKGLAEAKKLGMIAKALKMKEPDLILKLNAMENTFKNIEKVWFPGSGALGDLFGFLPMLGDALKQAGIK